LRFSQFAREKAEYCATFARKKAFAVCLADFSRSLQPKPITAQVIVVQAPAIITQPTNLKVTAGLAATLSVVSKATAPLNY
jgi:hypothetical protein